MSQPKSKTIIQVMEWNARQNGNRTAFRFTDGNGKETSITFEELYHKAKQNAAIYRSLGIPEKGRVLLLYPPSIEYITSLFGCFAAGVTAIPAYPPVFNRTLETLKNIVEDSGAQIACVEPVMREQLKPILNNDPLLQKVQWITLEQDAEESRHESPVFPAEPEDLAVLQYTSGSTGSPRGVMISHGNLLSNVDKIVEQLTMKSDDTIVAWLPPFHDMGLIGTIMTPMRAQAESVLMSPGTFIKRPIRWLEAITKYRGTITVAPNFAYDMCVNRTTQAQRESLDLSSLTAALNGAEKVREDTMTRFAETYEPYGFSRSVFRPCYGLAEATLCVTLKPDSTTPLALHFDSEKLKQGIAVPTDNKDDFTAIVGCGVPLPHTDVRIVCTDDRTPVKEGEVGEIWVNSESVSRGYWHRPELTHQFFEATLDGQTSDEKRYLATGDLAFIHNGELYVTGRKKDMIIILGSNFYPEDIEDTAVSSHAKIRPRTAIAFSITPREGIEKLVVTLEVNHADDISTDEIISAIRQAVSIKHQLPIYDIVLLRAGGQVSRTTSGKPRRNVCKEKYLSGHLEYLARSHALTPSNTLVDEKDVEMVQRIMAEVLNMDHVSEDDDFFALGGHSLIATQLVSRLEQIWEKEVPIRLIFEYPTAVQLAAVRASLTPAKTRKDVQRIDRNGILPLSHSQERMWFLHQLEPDGAAYNVSGALIIDGTFVPAHCRRAMQQLVDRHETLRTNYLRVDGEPRPVIHENAVFDIPFEDLSNQANPLEAATQKGSVLAHRPFNLADDLLIRAAVYKLSESRHAIVVSLHHIISDAWSLGVLLREILSDYMALQAGKASRNQPSSVQYVDYAAWQRPIAEKERFNVELDYWRGRLDGTPILELPTDRPRRLDTSSAGGMERLVVTEKLRTGIENLASLHQATPFMVMLLAFETLLYRYSRQTDFALGVPIANRNHHASEHLIGTLVNTLAFRAELVPEEIFTLELEKTRKQCLDAYAHQQLPFERLVQELKLERRPGQTPLIQVMFDYANPPMPSSQIEGLDFSPLFISRRAAQFDLSLLILDTEIGFIVAMEYRSDLFNADTVQRMLKQYERILESVVTSPNQKLCDINLLSEAEFQEIVTLGTSKNMQPVSEDTLIERVVNGAGNVTAKTAVADEDNELTYGEFIEKTGTAAAKLAAAGVTSGCRVAVCMERSRFLPAALLAVHWTDAAYVPIDPHFPRERVQFMLEDTAPTLIICDAQSRNAYPEMEQYGVLCIEDLETSEQLNPPPIRTQKDSTAYIIYTSGSTGKPKGVEIPQHAMLNFLESMAHTPGISASDHLLSVTTCSFDISVLELFLPLLCRATVTVVGSDTALNAQKLHELLQKNIYTIMQATPVTWRMLIEAGWQGNDPLTMLCGGEALPSDLADALLGRGKALWNMYGPTETTVWSTVQQILPEQKIHIGRPIDRTTLYILDKKTQLCPIGVAGEIFIGGAGVANGYFKRPELTASRFIPDPFVSEYGGRMYGTGDLGRLRANGTFECFGRLDHQVKVRGFRIELGEIETTLKNVPGVSDAVVYPHETTPGDTRLAAYYIAEDASIDSEELRKTLRRTLPGYMVPNWFVKMDQFPKTPNGKLDRNALPNPAGGDAQTRKAERIAPRNETEETLCSLWSKTLDVPSPSMTDNFFDMGHSLLAARLFARIDAEMGVSLPLSVLFANPTLEQLASYIANQKQESEKQTFRHIIAIKSDGGFTPLFCVHGAGGNVLNFEKLARYLDEERPLYGIQSRGVDGTDLPFTTIEETADAYLSELMSIQPQGPYIILGYCAGGIVAFEMATQLRAKGAEISKLILIDTFRPGTGYALPSFRKRVFRAMAKGPSNFIRYSFAKLHQITVDNINRKLVEDYLKDGRPVPHELRTAWLTLSFLESVEKYQLPSYEGHLTVFEAKDVPPSLVCTEPNLGWDGYAGSVTCYKVPGGHLTLTDEPHVQVLAQKINECLVRL